MKKIAAILFFAAVIISCGKSSDKSVDDIIDSENLSEIREKRAELNSQQRELSEELNKLDQAIERLNPNRNRTLVTTTNIQDSIFKHYAVVQGDVATDENIVIFPETSGILTDVRVSEGQQVSRAQTLAVVDDGGLSSELARLETQLALARTTYERQERLWEQNIGSEIQYLEARSNFEALQNSVNQIRSQLAKSTIKAPFSGIIDEVFIEQGEVVSAGQNQLFRLISLQNMYVEANIPENYLNNVQQGTEVIVEINSIGKQFTGEVQQVGNTINPSNRTFRVEIAIPNENNMVKPNQIATVRFNDYSNEDAIILPENAVQRNAQGDHLVYVWEQEGENNGVAREVSVETGYTYQGNIEITSGLQPGQTIIIEGSRNLRDGQEVRVRN